MNNSWDDIVLYFQPLCLYRLYGFFVFSVWGHRGIIWICSILSVFEEIVKLLIFHAKRVKKVAAEVWLHGTWSMLMRDSQHFLNNIWTKLKSNTSLLPCVIPFPASRLAGIQIAQINDLEFLESWIETMCSFQEGLCKFKRFPWEKPCTHFFSAHSTLLERQSHTKREDFKSSVKW